MLHSTLQTIEKVVDYVEDNVKKKLTLDEISDMSCVSKYHLHRIFKAVTNLPLMEYVTGRKLVHSTNELLNSNYKIIDVALEYGFEYEQNYIRCFRKQFDISPAKFRKEKRPIKIVDKVDFRKINPIQDGIIIEPQIVIRPEINLVGMLHKIGLEDNEINFTASKRAVEFFLHHKHKIQNAKEPDVYIGFTRYEPGTDYSLYLPSIEVENLNKIPEGMKGDTIPAGKYAVFKYIGLCKVTDITLKHLQEIYNYIFGVWLQRSGYKNAGMLHYESIDERVSKDDYCEVEIFMPIK